MSIGKKIKTIRILKGVEVKEIAKVLDITPQAYGKIERGESNISLQKLELLANYFKTDIEFIKNFDESFIFTNIQNTNGQVGFNNQFHLSESNSNLLKDLTETISSLKDVLIKNNQLLNSIEIIDKKTK